LTFADFQLHIEDQVGLVVFRPIQTPLHISLPRASTWILAAVDGPANADCAGDTDFFFNIAERFCDFPKWAGCMR
jgi:hypothetical protein